jgi:hypothetical protein
MRQTRQDPTYRRLGWSALVLSLLALVFLSIRSCAFPQSTIASVSLNGPLLDVRCVPRQPFGIGDQLHYYSNRVLLVQAEGDRPILARRYDDIAEIEQALASQGAKLVEARNAGLPGLQPAGVIYTFDLRQLPIESGKTSIVIALYCLSPERDTVLVQGIHDFTAELRRGQP